MTTLNTLPPLIEPQAETSVYRQVLSRCYPRLPIVSFEAVSEPFSSTRDYMILSGMKLVGHCSLNLYQSNQRPTLNFSYIEVYRQGKGHGVAAYLMGFEFAARRNAGFLSDESLLPKAIERWRKFVALGVAEYITRPVTDDEVEFLERADANEPFNGSEFRVLRPTEITHL